MYLARAILAATTLRGHAQLPLQFGERCAALRHLGNVAIGDSVANANDHDFIVKEMRMIRNREVKKSKLLLNYAMLGQMEAVRAGRKHCWRIIELHDLMLLPRMPHLREHLAKFWAEGVLRLEAAQVGLDFSADQALMRFACAMRIGAHERERASEHGL
jgi:hypothetical protein